jgi:release factor glutamine methyltransferase
MKSVLEVLKATTAFLEQKGFPSPRREAEELLSRALEIPRMQLYLDFERPLPEEELDKCRRMLQRRLAGEPYGYITGKQEFLNCQLTVTPAVLIPRQETEILAEMVVKTLETTPQTGKHLLDLCCGSGCLGLAIKKAIPSLHVTLSDLSTDALEIARQNCRQNQLDVTFAHGNLVDPFSNQKFDYIVCNPPYISEKDYQSLETDVKNFEPRGALVAGPTGLEIYATLAKTLPSVLNPGGKVWFEIGFDQGDSVPALFGEACWKVKRVTKDWAGHDRFFFLEIE